HAIEHAVRVYHSVFAERGVRDDGVGPQAHAVAEHYIAREHDADIDEDVAAGRYGAAHIEALRVGEHHAARHEVVSDLALDGALGNCELRAIVDPEHLRRLVDDDALHGHTVRESKT